MRLGLWRMTPPANLPNWPRALRLPLAAAYVGISPTAFTAHVAPAVKPIHPTPGTVAWLKDDLDRWLDALAGRSASEQEQNPWLT